MVNGRNSPKSRERILRFLHRITSYNVCYTKLLRIIRHLPDNSSYFARTYSVITELKKIAPNMKLLDMDSYDMKNKNSAKKLVMRWIKEYGKCLNGIISADDNMTLEGMNEAISLFNRHDIIRVAAGSNNIGLDLVKIV